MFRAPNPFDEIVARATDERLTSENWQLNMQVCDMVAAGDDASARQCLGALQKRLAHRSANVQLYALTLADALSNNAPTIPPEIASRAFMHALTRLVTNKNTHSVVKRRTLLLLREWARAYKGDTLGLVEETVRALREAYYEIDDGAEAEDASRAEQQRADDEHGADDGEQHPHHRRPVARHGAHDRALDAPGPDGAHHRQRQHQDGQADRLVEIDELARDRSLGRLVGGDQQHLGQDGGGDHPVQDQRNNGIAIARFGHDFPSVTAGRHSAPTEVIAPSRLRRDAVASS